MIIIIIKIKAVATTQDVVFWVVTPCGNGNNPDDHDPNLHRLTFRNKDNNKKIMIVAVAVVKSTKNDGSNNYSSSSSSSSSSGGGGSSSSSSSSSMIGLMFSHEYSSSWRFFN
jgi:uncharacterized membrane protein YgcG